MDHAPTQADLIIRTRLAVHPVSWQLVENAEIEIRGGRVAAIRGGVAMSGGSPFDGDEDGGEGEIRTLEFPDGVVLPAFTNCHTHLDLSHLRGQPLTGDDFGAWLSNVVRSRSAPRDVILTAVESTLGEMVSTGTAGVLDILAVSHCAADVARAILASPLRSLVAPEVLAFDPDGEEAALQATLGLAAVVLDEVLARENEDLACYLERQLEGERAPAVALSPHAPYTVSPRLYARVAEYAARHYMLQTTHMSESPAERTFLTGRGGMLETLFRSVGVDTAKMRWTTDAPVDAWLASAGPHAESGINDTLLVHCYDLTDGEIAALGERNATVVYCPRSRRYFGHPEFRYRELAAAGVTICLGTDSLGSNDNLDMLEELAVAAAEQPDVAVTELWRAATHHGARALSAAASTVRHSVTSNADLQIRALPSGKPDNSVGDLLAAILAAQPPCLATVIGGRVAHLRA